MRDKNVLEYFELVETYVSPRINFDEFLLIMTKDDIRKPVLLSYPKNRFVRKLRYFKKINFN